MSKQSATATIRENIEQQEKIKSTIEDLEGRIINHDGNGLFFYSGKPLYVRLDNEVMSDVLSAAISILQKKLEKLQKEQQTRGFEVRR
jgi:prefoldin subunit 5